MEWVMKEEFSEYLLESEFIDKDDPKVKIIAQYLMERAYHAAETNAPRVLYDLEAELVRQCFLLVRDEIQHTRDFGREDVVFKASEVLQNKTALCYGKTNVVCALLRALNIPCGIGYQFLRQKSNDESSPLILHALNFVYLEALGWFRIDARGNNEKHQTDFNVEGDTLAFTPDPGLGELDVPFIYAAHDLNVVSKMRMYNDLSSLWKDLPQKLAGKSILHKLK